MHILKICFCYATYIHGEYLEPQIIVLLFVGPPQTLVSAMRLTSSNSGFGHFEASSFSSFGSIDHSANVGELNLSSVGLTSWHKKTKICSAVIDLNLLCK